MNEETRTKDPKLTRRMQKIRKDILDAIPSTWLDPLLSGPRCVLTLPASGPDVETLLRAVKRRIADVFDEYDIKEKRNV